MFATPIRPSRLPNDPPSKHDPLLPTVVVASFSGGVGKTALTVAIAERLAWAGLRVLMLTCDRQEDGRHRIGVLPSDSPILYRVYGKDGSVTVAGIRGAPAIDVLYRLGPDKFPAGVFDIVVVDTSAKLHSGSLPGVLLITPVDGTDSMRNLVTMLRRTPDNTEIVLVRIGRETPENWAHDAGVMQQVLGHALHYLAEPLPRSKPVKMAHDGGRSVWTLARRGHTGTFLRGVDALAQAAWGRIRPKRPWPMMSPPSASSSLFVPGWDDDDA